MAFYRCDYGEHISGGSSDNCVIGELDCTNHTDQVNDYHTYTIPVDKKPKKFILYRTTYSGTYATDISTTNPSSFCYYDESVSATQYFVETDDANAVSTGLSGFYDIGETYDYTPIRSITDSAITFTLYNPYDSVSARLYFKYGGYYRYIIFY